MKKGRVQVAAASYATWHFSQESFVSRLLHDDHCVSVLPSLLRQAPPDDDAHEVSDMQKKKEREMRYFKIFELSISIGKCKTW